MTKRRTVDVLPRNYQPTKAELEASVKIDATPERLAKSLLRNVEVREVPVSHRKVRRRS